MTQIFLGGGVTQLGFEEFFKEKPLIVLSQLLACSLESSSFLFQFWGLVPPRHWLMFLQMVRSFFMKFNSFKDNKNNFKIFKWLHRSHMSCLCYYQCNFSRGIRLGGKNPAQGLCSSDQKPVMATTSRPSICANTKYLAKSCKPSKAKGEGEGYKEPRERWAIFTLEVIA